MARALGENQFGFPVEADIESLVIQGVELEDGSGSTRESIKPDGGAISGSPNDGGLLIAGRDNGNQRHVRVTAGGHIIVSPTGTVGTNIDSSATVPVGIGATVALAAPPADTLAMTVQNIVSGTIVAVREVGAGAGRGMYLPYLGFKSYGKAVEQLEVEHIAGVASAVNQQFQRP